MDAAIIVNQTYFTDKEKGFESGSSRRTQSFIDALTSLNYRVSKLHPKEVNVKTLNNYEVVVCRYMGTYYSLKLYKYRNIFLDFDDDPVIEAEISHKSVHKARILKFLAKLLVRNWYTSKPGKHCLPNIPKGSYIGTQDRIEGGNIALFVGSKYSPNALGITKFYKDIYQDYYKLYVVGDFYTPIDAEQPNWVRFTNCSDEELEELYRRSTIVVVPIYKSAGTCIKVLDAVRRGLPVVTTNIVAKDFPDLVEQGAIKVANSDDEFKELIHKAFHERRRLYNLSKYSLNYFTYKLLCLGF